MKPAVSVTFQPRIRVLRGADIALGPGKADLLQQIAAHGSITEAAGNLRMSYMRAWALIKTMERCFAEPLVKASRGGAAHGCAQLTAAGRRVLALYRRMERETARATSIQRGQMAKLIRS